MKKQEMAQTIGLLVIAAAVVLFVFFRLTQNAGKQQNVEKELSEMEKLASYDFDENYPKTVRDVMKLYCRYLKAVYSKDISEKDVETMNHQMRCLYAEELLNYNDESAQLASLKKEKEEYKKDKKLVVGYIMAEASQIVYETIEDVEYAKIRVTLNMKVGTSSIGKEQTYVLMKDAVGHWKIYGWEAD